jgi:hypothetical protein
VNNLVIQHGCTSCSSILRIIPKNADPEPLSVEITSSNLKVCLRLKPMHRSRREETSQRSIQNPCGRNQQHHLRSQLWGHHTQPSPSQHLTWHPVSKFQILIQQSVRYQEHSAMENPSRSN